MSSKPIFVVVGLGNGQGTGGFSARVFAKAGYRVALIARNAESVEKLASEINSSGGEAAGFPTPTYTYESFGAVFASIKQRWPDAPIRAALFNAVNAVRKGFLEITEADVCEGHVQTSILAGFAFAHHTILAFKANDLSASSALEGEGKRGTLIFTGATASIRGNVTTSAFAAERHAIRALSQSLAKEFGKENIHVAHAIIDGGILTERSKALKNDPEWEKNGDVRLHPESIAKTYLALVNQDRSAQTWELDLRPAHEKW